LDADRVENWDRFTSRYVPIELFKQPPFHVTLD
jgi:hypothetical protein